MIPPTLFVSQYRDQALSMWTFGNTQDLNDRYLPSVLVHSLAGTSWLNHALPCQAIQMVLMSFRHIMDANRSFDSHWATMWDLARFSSQIIKCRYKDQSGDNYRYDSGGGPWKGWPNLKRRWQLTELEWPLNIWERQGFIIRQHLGFAEPRKASLAV